MYYFDKIRGQDGARIVQTREADYPVRRGRDGGYKVPGGVTLAVCLTSDFFLPEADAWRDGAWAAIRERRDVGFSLLTKRPERILACLPPDWGEGWPNVTLGVSCENQRRADERVPLLLSLPFRHKRVMCAPLIGPVSLAPYLSGGEIEWVTCTGENYEGARPCDFAWVKALRAECEAASVNFTFYDTGTFFVKDGRRYFLPEKAVRERMAKKSGMSYRGRPVENGLTDAMGFPLAPPEDL